MKAKEIIITESLKEKFFRSVNPTDIEECWLWTGRTDKHGYGTISEGRNYRAHRVSYVIHFGKIDNGLLVCHHCDNPSCVNPLHLFLGTIKDNNRDRDNKGRHGCMRKTHCPKGHPYSGENLYIHADGSRMCRICISARKLAQRARRQAREAAKEIRGEA
ncbi:MAG: HNH endonuclease [Spirochaetes bacterium]|nr:MAG: HNH endonuclease [Spirochaetota bacterium]